MRILWPLFAAPVRRAARTLAAVVLVAVATPAFEAVPAQASGLPWPFPSHLSQPPHQAPPGRQPPTVRQGSLTEFDPPGANMVYSSAQYTACNTAFLGAIGCGTTALANNNLGDVVGTYTDAADCPARLPARPERLHHFFRRPRGGLRAGPGHGGLCHQ